jgi:DNA modification methylase
MRDQTTSELAQDANAHWQQRLVSRQWQNVTMINADCRDVNLEGDVMITDPPYGLGRYEQTNCDDGVVAILTPWKRRAVFGYPEILVGWCCELGKPDEWVTWWPTNKFGGRCGKNLPRTSEAIAIWGELYEKPTRKRIGAVKKCQEYHEEKYGYEQKPDAYDYDVWRDAAPGMAFHSHLRLHPNEKPESLMVKLVKLCSQDGETVCDPYAGSGTTAIACMRTNRKFVGCEKDAAHFKTACERIDREMAQGVLLPANDPDQRPGDKTNG